MNRLLEFFGKFNNFIQVFVRFLQRIGYSFSESNEVVNQSSCFGKLEIPQVYCHQGQCLCHGNTTNQLQVSSRTQSWLSLYFQNFKKKQHLVTHSLKINKEKCKKDVDLLLLLAIETELVPSSQGQYLVAAPNGSPPVPRNVCQNATLNLNQSCSEKKNIIKTFIQQNP